MSNLDKLITYFEKFPGIGGRQARRFAFHVLTMEQSDADTLAELVKSIKSTVTHCTSCQRFFAQSGGTATLCSICSDHNRDQTKLLIVAQDSDIQAIERSGRFDGLYFVLGGTVPLLATGDSKKLRTGALKAILEARASTLTEIILGFAVNPDGENTSRYLLSILEPLKTSHSLTAPVTQLGRGLSTGSELEYADPETIKNALENRH